MKHEQDEYLEGEVEILRGSGPGLGDYIRWGREHHIEQLDTILEGRRQNRKKIEIFYFDGVSSPTPVNSQRYPLFLNLR